MATYGNWSYIRLTGDKGADGADGQVTGIELRAGKALTNTYNRRNLETDTEDFTFYPVPINIDAENATYQWNLQGEYSASTLNDDNSITVSLYKDRACNFTVAVTITLADADSTQYTSNTLMVSDVENTPDGSGMFLGLLDEEPSDLSGLINGDYYVNENGEAFELLNGQFGPMAISDARYVTCCSAIFSSGIKLPSDSPMGQWIGNLISQNIVAQNIFSGNIDASSATFNNLTINNTSWFKGNIDSDVLKSYNGQASTRQATCASPSMYWRLSEAISALNSNNAVKTQNVTYNGTTYPYAVYVTDANSNFASQTLSIACPLVDVNKDRTWESITFTIPYNFTGSLNIGKSWTSAHGSTWFSVESAYLTAPMRLFLNSSETPFATYFAEGKTDRESEYSQQPDIKYWTVPSRSYVAGDTIKLEYENVRYPDVSIPFGGTGKGNYTATTTIYAKWSAYGLTSNTLCLLGQKIDTANTKLTSYKLINGSEYRNNDTISLASKRWCTWTNNIRVDGQQYANGECQVTGTVSVTINGSSIGFTPTRCIWGANGITFYNGTDSVIIVSGSWYTGFNFSFTYMTSNAYLKVDNVQPINFGQTNIGTETDKFNKIWAKEVHTDAIYVSNFDAVTMRVSNLNVDTIVDLVEKLYPIGSIYLNLVDSSPGNLFPNTSWAKLPEGYALWTATSDAGNTIDASLPKITGALNAGYAIGAQTNTSTATGAFRWGSGASYSWKYNSSGSGYRVNFDFDASRVASVYNNNTNKVQPSAYKIYAWQRVKPT